MPSRPDIRWDTPADRDAVLAFIAAMGFTPRDATTWDGLAMRAVCAWRGDRLVGVLPVEPRPIVLSTDATVPAAHLTCVAVHPDERGSGVGGALQRLLAAGPPAGARLLTVFREEPASPGYRWYLKNGFTPAMHVVSWTREIADTGRNAGATPLPRRATANQVPKIGVVDQRLRPLDGWLAVHPYRSRYRFETMVADGAYAVIAVGTLHSAGDRLDVLDPHARDADAARTLLLACVDRARARGIRSVRVALADRDPHAVVAADLGFIAGWNFDMLVKPVDASVSIDARDWRYASIDFA